MEVFALFAAVDYEAEYLVGVYADLEEARAAAVAYHDAEDEGVVVRQFVLGAAPVARFDAPLLRLV